MIFLNFLLSQQRCSFFDFAPSHHICFFIDFSQSYRRCFFFDSSPSHHRCSFFDFPPSHHRCSFFDFPPFTYIKAVQVTYFVTLSVSPSKSLSIVTAILRKFRKQGCGLTIREMSKKET